MNGFIGSPGEAPFRSGIGSSLSNGELTNQGTVLLYDDFQRPDLTALDAPIIGCAPTPYSTPWGIVGSTCKPKANVGESTVMWNVGPPPYIYQSQLLDWGDPGLVIRAPAGGNSTGNWVMLYPMSNTNKWGIYKRVSGTYTLLAAGTTVAAKGDLISCVVENYRMRLWVNNRLELTHSDQIHEASIFAGFRGNNEQTTKCKFIKVTRFLPYMEANLDKYVMF